MEKVERKKALKNATRNDKKKNWREAYVRLVGREVKTLEKKKKEKKEKIWEEVVPTKQEMREYYKSRRSKPRGK